MVASPTRTSRTSPSEALIDMGRWCHKGQTARSAVRGPEPVVLRREDAHDSRSQQGLADRSLRAMDVQALAPVPGDSGHPDQRGDPLEVHVVHATEVQGDDAFVRSQEVLV